MTPGRKEDEYTTWLFSTQRCSGIGTFSLSLVFPFRVAGIITDFDDPDLEMVDVRAATRHSELDGWLLGLFVSHTTLHLNKLTDAVIALKLPTSARHCEQQSPSILTLVSGFKTDRLKEKDSPDGERYYPRVLANVQMNNVRYKMCLHVRLYASIVSESREHDERYSTLRW